MVAFILRRMSEGTTIARSLSLIHGCYCLGDNVGNITVVTVPFISILTGALISTPSALVSSSSSALETAVPSSALVSSSSALVSSSSASSKCLTVLKVAMLIRVVGLVKSSSLGCFNAMRQGAGIIVLFASSTAIVL